MDDPESTAATGQARLAIGAMACMLYSALALAVLHVLRPDYAPASNFISNYAVGPYGWVMTTWFVAQAGGTALLVLGLACSGLRSVAAIAAMVLLLVEAIGLLVSAMFPVDLPGTPSTRAGAIHDLSFLVNVSCFMLAILLLPLGLGRHPGWRTFRRTAWLLAGLILLAFLVQFATMHKGMPYGLANRFFVLVALAWGLATATRLRTVLLRHQESRT